MSIGLGLQIFRGNVLWPPRAMTKGKHEVLKAYL